VDPDGSVNEGKNDDDDDNDYYLLQLTITL
jgi:hypothetical protein